MPTEEIVKKMQCKLRVKNDLLRCLFAEFLGIFILVTIADGGVASVVTNGMSGLENNVWLSFATCFGVAFGIWTGYGVSGGHVNPSVTIGLAINGKFPWRRVPFYFLAQFLGAFVASSVCFLIYFDSINNFDGGVRQAVDHPNATCGIFTTFPAEHITLTTGFFDQILTTGLMLCLIHVIGDRQNAGPPFGMAPLMYGLIVFAVLLSHGVNSGAPLNPARDFAGRVLCAMAGYGPKVWAPYGVQWWWIATFGPLLGAMVGSLIYLLLVEIHHPPEEPCPKGNLQEETDITDAKFNNPGFELNEKETEQNDA